MDELVKVDFPGGKRVDARLGLTFIPTDQRPENGGEGSAPAPFQLFLASIATCTGILALNFCEARELPTDGMSLTMSGDWDQKGNRFTRLYIHLQLPEGFPDKYRRSIIRAMDLCPVKKQIINPPEFLIEADSASAL